MAGKEKEQEAASTAAPSTEEEQQQPVTVRLMLKCKEDSRSSFQTSADELGEILKNEEGFLTGCWGVWTEAMNRVDIFLHWTSLPSYRRFITTPASISWSLKVLSTILHPHSHISIHILSFSIPSTWVDNVLLSPMTQLVTILGVDQGQDKGQNQVQPPSDSSSSSQQSPHSNNNDDDDNNTQKQKQKQKHNPHTSSQNNIDPDPLTTLSKKAHDFLAFEMNHPDSDREGFVSIAMGRTKLDAGAPYGKKEEWDSGLFVAVGWEGLEGSMSLESWSEVVGVGESGREGVQVEVHHVCLRSLGD